MVSNSLSPPPLLELVELLELELLPEELLLDVLELDELLLEVLELDELLLEALELDELLLEALELELLLEVLEFELLLEVLEALEPLLELLVEEAPEDEVLLLVELLALEAPEELLVLETTPELDEELGPGIITPLEALELPEDDVLELEEDVLPVLLPEELLADELVEELALDELLEVVLLLAALVDEDEELVDSLLSSVGA